MPVLILTALLAVLQGLHAKAEYSQGSTTLLVPAVAKSTLGDAVDAVNPLSATTLQTALIERLNSPDIARQVSEASGGGHVTAILASKGTTLGLSAGGTSRTQARQALAVGGQALQTQLANLQQEVGAPTSTFYRSILLSSDPRASVDYPQRSKGVLLVLIAGVLVAILAAEVTDVLAKRSRRYDDDYVDEYDVGDDDFKAASIEAGKHAGNLTEARDRAPRTGSLSAPVTKTPVRG